MAKTTSTTRTTKPSPLTLNPTNGFAYSESNEWIRLPTSLVPTLYYDDESCSFVGSVGFFFVTSSFTGAKFSYAPILKRVWRETSPLRFPMCNPLVGIFGDGSELSRFIVVGGVRFIGGLVDIEDRLAVEIYNTHLDNWELCPLLPADFRPGNSSQWLSSALFKGKFSVFGIYSCFISSFVLNKHLWSNVVMLKPSGVIFSFVIACQDQLVLAGLCNVPGSPCFNLWKIDEETMEFSEIVVMPRAPGFSTWVV